MNYLLDTNVISELRKPAGRANPEVRAWVASRPAVSMHLSVVTIMEIDLGIERLRRRDPAQADRLTRWLNDDVLTVFTGRILPVDLSVARQAARLHVPDPRPERDALIAATAITQGMTVVTRHTKDFTNLTVPVIDPWT